MIKMLTSVSGANFSLRVGEKTGRFSKEEEKRYVDSGQAEYVSNTPAKKHQQKNTSKK